MPDFKERFRALHARAGQREPIRADAPDARGDAATAVLRLYDPIDSWGDVWGVSAKEFVGVLDDLPDSVTTIRLLINSPGGEVTEAIAILNALRSHKAKVTAVVEGIAASAASVIACGVDELVMQPNSDLMIHDAWGACIGNADDMRSMVTLLDHLSDNIASIYAAKAGGATADWRALMAAETWFSPEEAVAAGLADSVGEQAAPPEAKARFDLSIFNFAGRLAAPEPKNPAVTPDVGPPNNNPEGGPAVAFSDEQFTHLRQALALSDEADEAAIFAALDTALQEYVEPPAPTPPAPVATLPTGVVAISEAKLHELETAARAGNEAREKQIRDERTALVDAAVRDGRIAPAEKDGWMAKLDAGTGAEAVLAALKPGLVPVTPLGSSGAVDLETDDDALYAELYGTEVKA